MIRRYILALAVSLATFAVAPFAQVAAPQAPAIPPELALDRTLPIDAAVRTGRLANGLR